MLILSINLHQRCFSTDYDTQGYLIKHSAFNYFTVTI